MAEREYVGDAYIITMHEETPKEPVEAALSCGFKPIKFKAITPDPTMFKDRYDMFNKCLPEIAEGRTYIRSKLSTGELALICSHRRAMETFVNDTTKGKNDWLLILEDDATLNPNVEYPKAVVKNVLHFLDSLKNTDGFVYFGLKVPTGVASCKQHLLKKYKVDVGADCHGCGTHAYAVTKKAASTLFQKVYSDAILDMGDSKPQIDQMYNRYFRTRRGDDHNFFITPFAYTPESRKGTENYMGLLYQGGIDRTSLKFGTHLKGRTPLDRVNKTFNEVAEDASDGPEWSNNTVTNFQTEQVP
jgi:GR25 family glycosyltransferase involved in LPS biosynthesis